MPEPKRVLVDLTREAENISTLAKAFSDHATQADTADEPERTNGRNLAKADFKKLNEAGKRMGKIVDDLAVMWGT
jgi:hypothetical protein